MTEGIVYDVIVVGAGIMGSFTAYHARKAGKSTLLLEQFPLPHNRGSSHGQSRTIRSAYGAQEYYTKMMNKAFRMWKELEEQSSQKLFRQTGLLSIGQKGINFLDETAKCLEENKIPFRRLDDENFQATYPMLSFPPGIGGAILDCSGGLLLAGRALTAVQNQYRKIGGLLKDGEKMVEVIPGEVIRVRTKAGLYKAKTVVLCVGPWAKKVLTKLGVAVPLQANNNVNKEIKGKMPYSVVATDTRLVCQYMECDIKARNSTCLVKQLNIGKIVIVDKPFKTQKIKVCYWKEKISGTFSSRQFPVFSQVNAIGPYLVYGVPCEEYPDLVKVCLHWGPTVDPDYRDTVDDNWLKEALQKYVLEHLPGLEPYPVITESCIYTNTPDDDFILDRHPLWDNIVIGTGFSGHGFKLAPVVGEILSKMATGLTPEEDLSYFKLNRFTKARL